MRKAIVWFMSEDKTASPPPLAEAFAKWIDAQREAIALVEAAQHAGHPEEWAEGYRWVTRIAGLAQKWAVEADDPLHPEIYLLQDASRKLLVDNPDVNYYFVRLDENETYRLTGNRGSAASVGLTVGTDFMRGASGAMGTVGQFELDDFSLDPNGDYEIIISRERHEGNWVPLGEGAAQIAVRETFQDRSAETPASYQVERLGDPVPPPVLTPQLCAERIENAAELLLFIVRAALAISLGHRANQNVISGAAGQDFVDEQDDEVATHSSTHMAYQGGSWHLGPDEGLSVTIHPPRGGALYWGITLVNVWTESYEYRYSPTATNNKLATANADGSWTLVIAPRDPGSPNWLDTGGRDEGVALIRWVHPASMPPNPSCEVIRIAT
ncbi:MAG: DUF1214 domain-containing protein [Myxococcota bacterium]